MRTSMRTFGVIALIACVCQGKAFGQNLVTNGGFETGDLTGWTLSSPACTVIVASFGEPLACFNGFINQVPSHSGKWAAIFPEGSPGTISQIIATNRNRTYNLSFWLISVNEGGVAPNEFTVSWGGVTLLDASNIATAGYTKFTFVGLKPTGDSTTLSFTGFDQPAALGLDDISVMASQNGQ